MMMNVTIFVACHFVISNFVASHFVAIDSVNYVALNIAVDILRALYGSVRT